MYLKNCVHTQQVLQKAGCDIWMTSKFVTNTLGWRDGIADVCGFILLIGQRFTHDSFIVQRTSPESMDVEKMDALYRWSYDQVKDWLEEESDG